MYACRGDEERNMYITYYLNKIKPHLVALIDEKKVNNKIQLGIAMNLIHLTKSDRITFYVKSKNIQCYISDNSEDILNQLYVPFWNISMISYWFVKQIAVMFLRVLKD